MYRLIACLLLLPLSSTAQTVWEWVAPDFPPAEFNALYAVGANNCLAAGRGGVLYQYGGTDQAAGVVVLREQDIWNHIAGQGDTVVIAGLAVDDLAQTPSDVYYSYDGGEFWTPTAQPTPAGEIEFVGAASTTQFYALTGDTLYSSSDTGATWSGVDIAPELAANPAQGFRVLPDRTLLLVTASGVYTSTNDGQTWTEGSFTALPVLLNAAVTQADSQTLYLVNGVTDSVYKSEDAGFSWSSLASPVPFVSLSFYQTDSGFAASATQLYQTTDGGQTWALVVDNPVDVDSLPFEFRRIAFVSATEGYALTWVEDLLGGQAQSWHRTPAVGTVGRSNNALSPTLSLYPNPASGAVTLAGLPGTGTRLRLRNLLGQEVLTEMPSGPVYTFSVQELPAGVYWVQVETAAGFAAVHRLVVQ